MQKRLYSRINVSIGYTYSYISHTYKGELMLHGPSSALIERTLLLQNTTREADSVASLL